MTTETTKHDLIALTAEIVTAYVAKSSVPLSEVPALISGVYASLDGLTTPPAEPVVDHTVSPAAIRKSITPDYLVSFVDGKRYKTLRRHLKRHGLTPEQYREKYGLGYEYPITASSYSAQRSELAKGSGLGQKRGRKPRLVA
ncbi:MucR family transcriptional regulator [Methylobacterium terricola]|uniref:MucR family transcriptional regulator n=1 Tax=Methylobacterium terricola TaxID=2583531 RepID=A0A5C4LN71_9HYPH|nr:MucR family transcriptional regulator [Methylobacterium terricola]TNC14889.1 MucR family transcriptional regulator [Methylobacterium terricola]